MEIIIFSENRKVGRKDVGTWLRGGEGGGESGKLGALRLPPEAVGIVISAVTAGVSGVVGGFAGRAGEMAFSSDEYLETDDFDCGDTKLGGASDGLGGRSRRRESTGAIDFLGVAAMLRFCALIAKRALSTQDTEGRKHLLENA